MTMTPFRSLVVAAPLLVVLVVSLISFNRELKAIVTENRIIFQFETDEHGGHQLLLSSSQRGLVVVPPHRVIPLLELVNTNRQVNCTPPLIRVNDTIVDDFHIDYTSHRIPKIVHVTSKSRCMSKVFADNIDKWRFEGWSFFFHDDEAVDRLLYKQYWPMFPQIAQSTKCMLSGAAKADLWRGLVLFEYGGVYTDIDNGPNKFNGRDYPRDEDDSLFVVEMIGVLSQYFMAASPRHPLMHQLVVSVMHNLYGLSDITNQYAPKTTGPGALKDAFVHFMSAKSSWDGWSLQNPVNGLYGRVTNGTYVGLGNRSVTVLGCKERNQEYVVRERIRGQDKMGAYREMGMLHFNHAEKEGKREARNESCFNRLYNEIDWSTYYEETGDMFDEESVS